MIKREKNRIAFFGDSLTAGIPGISFFNILKDRLPDDYLINYGKGGDTVISLYQRIRKLNTDTKFDIAILWIGTNDIFVKVSRIYPIIKTLLSQPWTRNTKEFTEYYQKILELLIQRSQNIFTVTPLFLGENIDNKWNNDLKKLSEIIELESERYKNVKFINLHDYFTISRSDSNQEYIARHPSRVLVDVIKFRQRDKVDKKSMERGLIYTLDGVHLNSRGAELVSDIFYHQINKIIIKNKLSNCS